MLSFRLRNLPHTDTEYVQPSPCCPLVLTGRLPTMLQSAPPPPFLARMMTYSTQFVNKRHMICLVVFFSCLPRQSLSLITQARIRQNSMSAYKQPNAKFMSCGISCSVINYRYGFQVKKKANCSPGSLLTLRDSLVIESNGEVHELRHEDKLDKSCQATLLLTRLGTLYDNVFVRVLERKTKKN